MSVSVKPRFTKSYEKRFANNAAIAKAVELRLHLLEYQPTNPMLRVHRLRGQKHNLWSCSVTGDIRILFYREGDNLVLLDIGTHNQVY